MTQTPKQPDPQDYAEEAIPFDDVMRQLLRAKPQPKDAKPKPDHKTPKAE